MVNCCVVGCGSRTERKDENISLHRFPKDPALRNLWIKKCGRKNWKPNTNSRICSLHFEPDFLIKTVKAFKLHSDAYPSLSNEETKNELKPQGLAFENQEKMRNEDDCATECRTCLRFGDRCFYKLSDIWFEPGHLKTTLGDTLKKIANIQISEKELHSESICSLCFNQLKNTIQFLYIVRQNDQILKLRRIKKSHDGGEVNDVNWPKPIQLDRNINENLYGNSLEVEVKQEVLSDEEQISTEYGMGEGHTDNGEDGFEIKIEPEEIVCQQPFKITVNGTISLSQYANNQESVATEDDNWKFENEEYLDRSVKDEPLSDEGSDLIYSDITPECILCSKTFKSLSGLKAHVIAIHSYKSVKRKAPNDESPVKRVKHGHLCATCRRSFTTLTDLMVHETCHNKATCYRCHSNFDTFDQLTEHRVTCKAASKEVYKLVTLNDVKRRAPNKVYENKKQSLKCPLCSARFSDEYYMTIHREIHHSSLDTNIQNNFNKDSKIIEPIVNEAEKAKQNLNKAPLDDLRNELLAELGLVTNKTGPTLKIIETNKHSEPMPVTIETENIKTNQLKFKNELGLSNNELEPTIEIIEEGIQSELESETSIEQIDSSIKMKPEKQTESQSEPITQTSETTDKKNKLVADLIFEIMQTEKQSQLGPEPTIVTIKSEMQTDLELDKEIKLIEPQKQSNLESELTIGTQKQIELELERTTKIIEPEKQRTLECVPINEVIQEGIQCVFESEIDIEVFKAQKQSKLESGPTTKFSEYVKHNELISEPTTKIIEPEKQRELVSVEKELEIDKLKPENQGLADIVVNNLEPTIEINKPGKRHDEAIEKNTDEQCPQQRAMESKETNTETILGK